MTTPPAASITITIEGAGFTFSDAFAVDDASTARDAARKIAQYAMSQLGGSRRRSRDEDSATPAATT